MANLEKKSTKKKTKKQVKKTANKKASGQPEKKQTKNPLNKKSQKYSKQKLTKPEQRQTKNNKKSQKYSKQKPTKQDKKKFEKIVNDIEEVKIQGARNIAEKALIAYNLVPTSRSKKKLLSLRPTEPMLNNVLSLADKYTFEEILEHFDSSKESIKKHSLEIIKTNDLIFTHCHSSSVVDSLIYAKNNKKEFSVYNTETRPLFQGRKTANELRKAGIKVTLFVDSAVGVALSKKQGTKQPDKVFLGADALLKKGIVNKIGSEVICRIAKENNIPVYIFADSWKFSKKPVKLEKRDWKEIWKTHKKHVNLKIQNPAFEFVPKKYITGIVSEFGVMTYKNFLKRIRKIEDFPSP